MNSWFEMISIVTISVLFKFKISSKMSVILLPTLYGSAALHVPVQKIILKNELYNLEKFHAFFTQAKTTMKDS